MSNTSEVTPYSATPAGAVSAGVASWLNEETPRDRAVRRRLIATRRREALGNATAPIHSVSLRLRDKETLLSSAEVMGFDQEPVRATAERREAALLLRKPTGERLAIERTADGALTVHTAGDRQHILDLVRQHTVDQTLAHFQGQRMRVEAAESPTGGVQFRASAQTAQSSSAGAQVQTEVYADGSLCVDVGNVRGGRCLEIVNGLAAAVGGEVTATDFKEAWFERPGEATRTRERV